MDTEETDKRTGKRTPEEVRELWSNLEWIALPYVHPFRSRVRAIERVPGAGYHAEVMQVPAGWLYREWWGEDPQQPVFVPAAALSAQGYITVVELLAQIATALDRLQARIARM